MADQSRGTYTELIIWNRVKDIGTELKVKGTELKVKRTELTVKGTELKVPKLILPGPAHVPQF